ncbi:MAG: ABC transporter permease [Deltaproteobacteria bacterium]|nr:ABC transporter permease [Deltaproteobacteria bacterium]
MARHHPLRGPLLHRRPGPPGVRGGAVNALLDLFGRVIIEKIEETGRFFLFLLETLRGGLSGRVRWKLIIQQMEFVGVRSISVVVLTGTFTGMVLALQSVHAFRKFGAEGLVGTTVALSMMRELGPVLTSLMVTARAGSAMAAELGTMRVTEQIDALAVMAVDPVEYLVVPRMLASFAMLPILCCVSDLVGVLGGYFVGVKLLGISHATYVSNTLKYLEYSDIFSGLVKAACFGVILAAVGCYKGYVAWGGAQGVGRATTEAVVVASVLILVNDYFLTAIMF